MLLQRSINIHNVITQARNHIGKNSYTTTVSSSSSSSFVRRRLLLLENSELLSLSSTADTTTNDNNNKCIQFYHVSIMSNEPNTCTNSGVYVSLYI